MTHVIQHCIILSIACRGLPGSVTLPNIGTKNSDQLQHHALLYMVLQGSTLEWCIPCAPSCLKIYLCYELFPSLNSHFTILFNYFSLFLCLLSATNRLRFHFILHDFTIKSLYIEKQIRSLLPLRTRLRNSFTLRISFMQLRDIIALRRSLPACCLSRSLVVYFIAPHRALSHFAPCRTIPNSF